MYSLCDSKCSTSDTTHVAETIYGPLSYYVQRYPIDTKNSLHAFSSNRKGAMYNDVKTSCDIVKLYFQVGFVHTDAA